MPIMIIFLKDELFHLKTLFVSFFSSLNTAKFGDEDMIYILIYITTNVQPSFWPLI